MTTKETDAVGLGTGIVDVGADAVGVDEADADDADADTDEADACADFLGTAVVALVPCADVDDADA